jgi:hypothetical protein
MAVGNYGAIYNELQLENASGTKKSQLRLLFVGNNLAVLPLQINTNKELL